MNDQERNKYFQRQYEHGGGFCYVCSNGIAPIINDDIEAFGLCEFGGKHPKPKLGDPNYNSGHSIDVNGNCNMGCC